MPRIASKNHLLMSAVGSATAGTTASVKEYRHKMVDVTAAINSSLTFKFQVSDGASATSDAAPDFTAAQSATNMWDYVGCYDTNSGSFVAGDTGVTLNDDTVANNTRRYLINDDHSKYLNVVITSYTDGSLTAVGAFAND